MTLPESDEIEVTVFGPGYGECIVIHIGSGKWAIVDSCLDDNQEPAALAYLSGLGVPVDQAVVSVSATHWHDDHIKGLAKTAQACSSARLALGAALRRTEFVAFLQVHEDQPVQKLDRGGTELLNCLRLAKERGRPVKVLQEDTIIFDYEEHQLAHGERVELRALSPSAVQFTDFLRRIGKFPMTHEKQPKRRILEPSRNDLSVAMLLSVGKKTALLGADLEEVGNQQKGWQAVVDLRRGKGPAAEVFKVPHHGSQNAHNNDVWQHMLSDSVWSVVTPWRRGGNYLPKKRDIERLQKFSGRCYLTSSKVETPKRRYGNEILKLVKAADVKLDTAVYSGGRVTVRWVPKVGVPTIRLVNGAKAM